jgi:pimeloyl-ACP methyl ester carboxylesterase
VQLLEVSTETGAVIAAFAGVLGGLWGGLVSVRAATRGPQWALDYLKRWYPILLGMVLVSIAVLLLVSPGWVGVSLIYVSGIVAWMARSVTKSLQKVRGAGVFEPLPPDRQAVILSRAARWLMIGGGAILVVAILDFTWRGWPAAFDLVLAGALIIPGLRIRSQAEQLREQADEE